MKTKLTLSLLAILLLACTKNNHVALSTQLTDCPANTTCRYIYYDHTSLINADLISPGNNRVFLYQSINKNECNASSSLYFITPVSNNDFNITSSQISSGLYGSYGFICPCCDVVGSPKMIGGSIKGTKKGANIWLVNATVIFGDASSKPTDTITVNQYFTFTSNP